MSDDLPRHAGDGRGVVGADRAVVDRIVDGSTAVLLVGPAGDQLTVPADLLPDDATEGTWLVLDTEVTPPTVLAVDGELTASRRADVADRLARVRARHRGGRFDRPDGA